MVELFERSAHAAGKAPLIDFLSRHFSYAETLDGANRVAAGLQALGYGPGDRIGLFLPNVPHYLAAYYGILKIGATVVNFSPLYTVAELEHQVADSGTRVLFTLSASALLPTALKVLDGSGLERLIVGSIAGALPSAKSILYRLFKRAEVTPRPHDPRVIAFSHLIANDGRYTPATIDPERDVALIQYTGGTTGVPKGAALTHQNLSANARQVMGIDPHPGPPDRILGVLPLFHVFAMTTVMNLGIRMGAELILLPRFELDTLMEVIQRKRPTLFPAVPTIYTAILHHPRVAEYDLSSIRFCISGGAPLPLEVKQGFEARTGCKLVEGYGLTEAAPVTHANPLDAEGRAGSIGLPLPGTVVEIVSLEERSRVLPPGERGEVCIRGPQVMKGYWNRPEETAETLADGRLHTGDVGYLDADGYTYIVDRIKDLILCGGYNVYPRVVEEAIYLHPSVAECVVAGVPDPYRGQTVKAYIKLLDGHHLTAEELIAFLKDKLSPIEMPRIVEFRDELPSTLVGKLSRKALLEEEAARAAQARTPE